MSGPIFLASALIAAAIYLGLSNIADAITKASRVEQQKATAFAMLTDSIMKRLR